MFESFSPTVDSYAIKTKKKPTSRALSTKLHAYIALLEKAPTSDLARLLEVTPEDIPSPPESPRAARSVNIPAVAEEDEDEELTEAPGSPSDMFGEDVFQVSMRTSRGSPKNQSARYSPGQGNNTIRRKELDVAAKIAVRGDTLLTTGANPTFARAAAMQLVMTENVVIEAKRKEQRKIDIRRQGNLNFYRDSVMDMRMELFESPGLQAVFYNLFQALPQKDGRLTERGYKWLYKRLYWRVVKEGERVDCEALADAEWQAESGGCETMDFEHFYEGMFNFVDIWCEDTEEDAYIDYAETLCLPLLSDLSSLNGQGLQERKKNEITFVPPALGKVLEEIQRSNERTHSYGKQKIGPRQVYLAECARLGCDANPSVSAAIGDSPVNNLKVLKLVGIHLPGLGPLVDVIRMNKDLEHISLKNCRMEPSSITMLCNILAMHNKLQVLDISGNQPVSTRGATAINRLLCRNPNITVCRFNNTVPASLRTPIMVQLEANFHAQALGREEYFELKKAFEEMDKNKDGLGDLQELIHFFVRFELKKSEKASICIKAQWRTKRAAERLARNLLREADESRDRRLTFCELLGHFYPNISLGALQRFIDYYEDPDSPINRKRLSTEAIEAIFKSFDTDGSNTLSIKELQMGLEQSGQSKVWEKYQTTFQRYDLDGDDNFSLEEFVMLMALLDNCSVKPRAGH